MTYNKTGFLKGANIKENYELYETEEMSYSGMCRGVVLVRTDVSEKRITSIFRVKAINELRTVASY
jgi:hypothetical protein